MTSPATMRMMGLLVIVGMVPGCGGEPTAPGGAAAVAGTYRLHVDKSVQYAIKTALTHESEWLGLRTSAERDQALATFEAEARRVNESRNHLRVSLREDGTCLCGLAPEGVAADSDDGWVGTWSERNGRVDTLYTHMMDGTRIKHIRDVYRLREGSLYETRDTEYLALPRPAAKPGERLPVMWYLKVLTKG